MSEQVRSKMKHLPLNQIKAPADPLRQVNKKKAEYLEFVDSIRSKGILNPILVRELKDNSETPYSVIEGLHRYTGAIDAGLTEIPCQIVSMNDAEIWEAQIIGNLHKIETRPADYAKTLEKIFRANPTLTKKQLSAKLNKSTTWLDNQLKLNVLPENVKKLVNEGNINVSNAYALANLSSVAENEVENFLSAAQTTPPNEFTVRVDTRVRQIKAERRQGRDPKKNNEFEPIAHPQNRAAFEAELRDHKNADVLIPEMGASTPLEGWIAAIKWSLKLDPRSVAAAKATFDAEKAATEAAKAERKAAREKAALEEAAKLSVIS